VAGLGSTSLLRVQRSSRVVAAPPLLARQAHLLAERARRQLTRQLSREARRPHVHRRSYRTTQPSPLHPSVAPVNGAAVTQAAVVAAAHAHFKSAFGGGAPK